MMRFDEQSAGFCCIIFIGTKKPETESFRDKNGANDGNRTHAISLGS